VRIRVRVRAAKSPASSCSVLATMSAADTSAQMIVGVRVGVNGEGRGER